MALAYRFLMKRLRKDFFQSAETPGFACLAGLAGIAELEATIVEKHAAVEAFLDEPGRRIRAATESCTIGYGGDSLVSDATGLSRPTIRAGRRELEAGSAVAGRIRRPGAGRPGIREALVDPLTRGDMEKRYLRFDTVYR